MSSVSQPAIGWVAKLKAIAKDRPVTSVAFDGGLALLGAWFVGGLFLDGWAHLHIPELETFFSPWHGVLYSGYFVTSAYLALAIFRNWRRGYSGLQAVPVGYELSVIGVLIFLVGGAGDMTWHIVFGIEENVEALLSPTHLLLATGMLLIIAGPLRAAWLRSKNTEARWATHWPALLCLTYLVMVFGFFTQYAHPFGITLAARPHWEDMATFGSLNSHGEDRLTYYLQGLGLVSVFLQTSILMGLVLVTLRRWRLPLGSITLVLTLSTFSITIMRYNAYFGNPIDTGILPLVLAAALTGISADLLIWRFRPSPERSSAFHWFAFLVPVLLYALYFLAIALTGGGIWWTIHLWTGTIVMAGIVGLLLSFAMMPPEPAAT